MTVTARRARIYDLLAFLTIVLVISLDQWTKALVVAHLSPPDSGHAVPLIGEYLTLYYIQNSGAAFGLFANSLVLGILIAVAVGVIALLYLRGLNSSSLAYKLVFGLIIGGALGNLTDRFFHSGYVVDFIFFRIPQIGFSFAIFNLADSAISIGVVLLFFFILFSGSTASHQEKGGSAASEQKKESSPTQTPAPATSQSGTARSGEQDGQS